MLSWLFRYRRGSLSDRHPRWAALDSRLDTDREDVTRAFPVPEVTVNPVTPWWTHPDAGAERLVRDVDRTEVRPLPVDTHHHNQ